MNALLLFTTLAFGADLRAVDPPRPLDVNVEPRPVISGSPTKAAIAGLFFPGGAYFYAGGEHTTQGWSTLAISGTLIGGGTLVKKPSERTMYMGFGAAYWLIMDFFGVHMIKEQLSLQQTEQSTQLTYSRRF